MFWPRENWRKVEIPFPLQRMTEAEHYLTDLVWLVNIYANRSLRGLQH